MDGRGDGTGEKASSSENEKWSGKARQGQASTEREGKEINKGTETRLCAKEELAQGHIFLGRGGEETRRATGMRLVDGIGMGSMFAAAAAAAAGDGLDRTARPYDSAYDYQYQRQEYTYAGLL